MNSLPLVDAGALETHAAAVELDDAAHERQSDPQPLGLMRGVTRLVEEVEDVGQHVRGDANPFVADVHDASSAPSAVWPLSRRSARFARPGA